MADKVKKLPKQWRHWCQLNHLEPYWNPEKTEDGRRPCRPPWHRKDHSWWYLMGAGFVWRVNMYGMFQRGDRLADFDRWALCNIDEVPMPTSAVEFTRAVIDLRKAYREEDLH